MNKWNLDLITIKDIREHLEEKGYSAASVHWLLFKNGFYLYVENPFCKECNNINFLKNRKAIVDTWIEIQYLKHYE